MRKRFFWVLIVLTSLAIAGQPAALGYRETSLDHPPKSTVSFDLYRDYLIVVRGSAGPLKGLSFLLDTGATPSVLDPLVAAKLHLDITPIDIAVVSGSAQGGSATLTTLQLGPLHKDNFRVLIEDLSFIQKALPIQIDGIVGLDVLGQSAFVIDYASREIRFGPAPSMQLSTPLQMKQGLPIIDAIINHTSVQLVLDTGAPSLILFDQVLAPAPAGSPKNIGDFDRKQTRQISLMLADTDFGSKPAFMVQNFRDAGHNFDGLVSPAALGITRVSFDFAQGTVAFTRKP